MQFYVADTLRSERFLKLRFNKLSATQTTAESRRRSSSQTSH
jgi:hypothetical protein